MVLLNHLNPLQFLAVSAVLLCSFTDEVQLYLNVLNKYFLHYSLLVFLTLFASHGLLSVTRPPVLVNRLCPLLVNKKHCCSR